MKASAVLRIMAVVAPGVVLATVKMSCLQLVVERLDPLTQPGATSSSHVHQVVGGNGFNATMGPSVEPSSSSTCTSCTFKDDLSNYWTPSMYFRARNGSYKRVKQLNEGANGGMTIYYFESSTGNRVTAFKPGFRMRNGDRSATDKASASRFQGIRYNCLVQPDTHFARQSDTFPTYKCKFGIITQVLFPTCWDGVNLDLPDHSSHVKYPTVGDVVLPRDGCPFTHPVRIPQLVLEARWDTAQFNSPDLWPVDGSNPFVWSSGDNVGYGYYGDFVFGWKGDTLQRLLDSTDCEAMNGCGLSPLQDVAAGNQCVKGQMVKEDVDGWLDALPGAAR